MWVCPPVVLVFYAVERNRREHAISLAASGMFRAIISLTVPFIGFVGLGSRCIGLAEGMIPLARW